MSKYYAASHEWAQINDQGLIEIGISDYAQHALGDIVFISFPNVGESVQQQAHFGDVESVKAVSELFAPVSGKIIEVNEDLFNAPEKLNQDPLTTWILRVEGSSDLSHLMDEETYLASLKDH